MSKAGPELPPHLATKRKHEYADEGEVEPDAEPANDGRSVSPGSEKRRRIFGPAPPPAPLDERPDSSPTAASGGAAGADVSSSSDDDDFGPAPPAAGDLTASVAGPVGHKAEIEAVGGQASQAKPQREEWMLVPPSQDDWTARVDPTKLRNRKFNSGKGAKARGPASTATADQRLWTETAAQKRQRLEDEVMGVARPATAATGHEQPGPGRTERDRDEAAETARRIDEYNAKNRNTSLYKEHQKKVSRDAEDDPSKRAFDREKDIAGGQKIGHAKRKEMLSRAADFGSKFARGSYL